MSSDGYSLRPMNEHDLDRVHEWRNAPEIRVNMYRHTPIPREEHVAWFESIQSDATKKYFICCFGQTPVGVVGFYGINYVEKSALWAFYSGDTSRRGVGSHMEYLALNYAFGELGLRKLSAEVLSFNKPVLNFHRKFGFHVEGLFRKAYTRDGQYHDIYRIAIFSHHWHRSLEPNYARKLNYRPDGPKFNWLGKTEELEVSVTEDDVATFAAVSGDRNPVHLDAAAAQRVGFEGVICHGVHCASLFSRVLGMALPGEGTIYKSQTLRFRNPVYPEQRLTVRVKVVSEIGRNLVLSTELRDEQGDVCLEGEAEVLAPKEY